jgi:hypothetical protein
VPDAEGPRGFQLVGDAKDPTEERGSAEQGGAPVTITFASFLVSLSTSALIPLGIPPGEEAPGVEPEKNLPLARQTVDILEMLRVKTEGNLDEEEARLFDAILHDLRMRYVEASRS